MTIKITPEAGGRFRVETKIKKLATMRRNVMEASLPSYLASVAELGTQTHNRHLAPTAENPFDEVIHG